MIKIGKTLFEIFEKMLGGTYFLLSVPLADQDALPSGWRQKIILRPLTTNCRTTLGSFRLQWTCTSQRSRENVCPQHKGYCAYVFVHYSTYNRKLPNVCPQHKGYCACAAFSTYAQHVHYPNLELKTDRFHVVHRPVTPLTVASGRRGGA